MREQSRYSELCTLKSLAAVTDFLKLEGGNQLKDFQRTKKSRRWGKNLI